MITVNSPSLIPRWYQTAVWKAYWQGVKNMVLSWPRRHGKDMTSSEILKTEALRHVDNYWYLYPTRAHADRVVWQKRGEMMIGGKLKSGKVVDFLFPPEIVKQKREKDLSIELINGSLIMFGGTDDGSFVGQGGRGYLLAEASLHKNDVTGLIAPIQEESDAFLLLQGTMRGKHNHLHKIYQANKNREGWFAEWLLPEQTKMYYWDGPDMQLNMELAGMISPYTNRPYTNIQDLVDSCKISYTLARQEFTNEAVAMNDHGYYLHEYEKAKAQGRIGTGEYNKDLPVYTFWDLGKGTAAKCTDAMAVWFVQFPHNDLPEPSSIRLIGFEETRGGVWADHATNLRKKGWEYGGHYMPWDINKGAAGMSGSNLQWAKEAGIEFTPVQRRGYGVMTAIEICRRLWGKLEFAKGTATDGAERLSEYHEKKDRDGNMMGTPDHDSHSSNVADSYRTMVEALDKKVVRYNPPADRTQGDKGVIELTMSRAGGSKPVEEKPMLCSKGEGATQKSLADIKRIRDEKRQNKWKR